MNLKPVKWKAPFRCFFNRQTAMENLISCNRSRSNDSISKPRKRKKKIDKVFLLLLSAYETCRRWNILETKEQQRKDDEKKTQRFVEAIVVALAISLSIYHNNNNHNHNHQKHHHCHHLPTWFTICLQRIARIQINTRMESEYGRRCVWNSSTTCIFLGHTLEKPNAS